MRGEWNHPVHTNWYIGEWKEGSWWWIACPHNMPSSGMEALILAPPVPRSWLRALLSAPSLGELLTAAPLIRARARPHYVLTLSAHDQGSPLGAPASSC